MKTSPTWSKYCQSFECGPFLLRGFLTKQTKMESLDKVLEGRFEWKCMLVFAEVMLSNAMRCCLGKVLHEILYDKGFITGYRWYFCLLAIFPLWRSKDWWICVFPRRCCFKQWMQQQSLKDTSAWSLLSSELRKIISGLKARCLQNACKQMIHLVLQLSSWGALF